MAARQFTGKPVLVLMPAASADGGSTPIHERTSEIPGGELAQVQQFEYRRALLTLLVLSVPTGAGAHHSLHSTTAVFVSCNRNDVLALGSEGEYPGIVILVRRRTRQAEIAAMRKLLTGAGKQGLANNINFA